MQEKLYENEIIFSRFLKYMKKALFHKKLDYIKHQEYLHKNEFLLSNEEWSVLSKNDNTVHSFCVLEEEFSKIKNAIKLLSEKEQIIIIKYYYFDISLVKIAQELNISNAAIKKAKSRAIIKLKKILES